VREALGLGDDEVVVALVHLGPPATDPPPKARAPVDDVFIVQP
jgi:nitroreductase